MWKLIIVAIIAFAIWAFLNPNALNSTFNNIENQALNNLKQEKTINTVNGANSAVNSELNTVERKTR